MVFDFLRRGAAGEAPEVKASAAGTVVAWQTGGRVAWSPILNHTAVDNDVWDWGNLGYVPTGMCQNDGGGRNSR